MMDHSLRSISYIADIGDLLVIMARRRIMPQDGEEIQVIGSTPKMICHVFESEEVRTYILWSGIGYCVFSMRKRFLNFWSEMLPVLLLSWKNFQPNILWLEWIIGDECHFGIKTICGLQNMLKKDGWWNIYCIELVTNIEIFQCKFRHSKIFYWKIEYESTEVSLIS